MSDGFLEIRPDFRIPLGEVEITASRSGGPGGQNVNKVSTRITVRFNVCTSPSVPDEIRGRLLSRLGSRLTLAGEIVISCQESRSQLANREGALDRLSDLLRSALVRRRPRIATHVPMGEKVHRLESKKRRSSLKEGRRKPLTED